MKKANSRTAWFERGVTAIQQIASTNMAGAYICPLCIRAFDRKALALLTKEDAPPRALGGRPIALTCKECNNAAGTNLDSQMVAELNFEKGWARRPLTSRLEVGDVSANVELSVEQPEIRVSHFGRHNSPATSEALRSALDSIYGQDLRLHIRLGHDARLAQVGWLRSAYVVAFAALGYSYILQPSLDVVRQQFQNPRLELIKNFVGVRRDGLSTTRKLGLTSNPSANLDVIAVQMGTRVVLLPGFSPDIDVYEELAAVPNGSPFESSLTEIAWPGEPRHDLDSEAFRRDHLRLELRPRPPAICR